jgi:hypothetical protein
MRHSGAGFVGVHELVGADTDDEVDGGKGELGLAELKGVAWVSKT